MIGISTLLPVPSFSVDHVHPILVNFTAALVPSSLGSDVLAKLSKKRSLSDAAWWMISFAAMITPFTAVAGLLWKKEVQAGAPPALLHLHMWLGISVTAALIALAIWRGTIHARTQFASTPYLLMASLVMAVLIYQGSLGGLMAFGF